MSRFAGLVITVGVGAAVLSGQGVARAEPADSSADSSSRTSTDSSTDSGSASSTATGAPRTSDAPKTAAVTNDSPESSTAASTSTGGQTTSRSPSAVVDTGDSPNDTTLSNAPSDADPATSKDRTPSDPPSTPLLPRTGGRSHPDSDTRAPSNRNSAVTSPAAATMATAVPKVGNAELSAPTAQVASVPPSPPTATFGDVRPSSGASTVEPAVQQPDTSQPAAAAVPASPLEVVAGVVSNLLGGLLNPLAAGKAPPTPAGAPVAWSLLAFARREFETAVTPPSVADVPAAVQTTSTTQQAARNSLTYTPPPTIIDELTIAGLRLVRDITGLFGIPYTAVLSQLITSEDPPFFLTLGLNARQTEFEVSPGDVWKVWEFEPPNPTGATVVAMHGGGAIYQPNVLHWIDYTQMARDTGATVLVPMYPLARTEAGSLLNVTPGMTNYLSHVIDERGARNVSVYADSAGATLGFAAARQLILRGDDVPASMVVLSGQADYSSENDGAGIDDPFFNQVTVDYFSKGVHTFDGIVDKDPRISPLRMETEVLQALPPTTMYVGTLELLLPGNLQLYQRAVDIGAPISLVVGRGQFHDWPLAGLPTNSAAPLVRRDVYRQLGLLPTSST